VEPDLLDAHCPSRQVLDRIGDRWSVLVVHLLGDGPRRYGQLSATIQGISQKMLTQTLRGLERDGLLTRTVHATVPPRVDYELTALGRSLLSTIRPLTAWATTHIDEVLAAREAYDGRPT
jgi:DNA-binding HxlR family transcriptional regulator